MFFLCFYIVLLMILYSDAPKGTFQNERKDETMPKTTRFLSEFFALSALFASAYVSMWLV